MLNAEDVRWWKKKINIMEKIFKTFEIQFDEKPNGAVIRLNDENGCILRVCGVPKRMVFEPNGEVKPYIDITYPK